MTDLEEEPLPGSEGYLGDATSYLSALDQPLSTAAFGKLSNTAAQLASTSDKNPFGLEQCKACEGLSGCLAVLSVYVGGNFFLTNVSEAELREYIVGTNDRAQLNAMERELNLLKNAAEWMGQQYDKGLSAEHTIQHRREAKETLKAMLPQVASIVKEGAEFKHPSQVLLTRRPAKPIKTFSDLAQFLKQ